MDSDVVMELIKMIKENQERQKRQQQLIDGMIKKLQSSASSDKVKADDVAVSNAVVPVKLAQGKKMPSKLKDSGKSGKSNGTKRRLKVVKLPKVVKVDVNSSTSSSKAVNGGSSKSSRILNKWSKNVKHVAQRWYNPKHVQFQQIKQIHGSTVNNEQMIQEGTPVRVKQAQNHWQRGEMGTKLYQMQVDDGRRTLMYSNRIQVRKRKTKPSVKLK